VPTHFSLGVDFLKKGDYDSSIREWKQVIAINGGDNHD